MQAASKINISKSNSVPETHLCSFQHSFKRSMSKIITETNERLLSVWFGWQGQGTPGNWDYLVIRTTGKCTCTQHHVWKEWYTKPTSTFSFLAEYWVESIWRTSETHAVFGQYKKLKKQWITLKRDDAISIIQREVICQLKQAQFPQTSPPEKAF